MSNASPSAQLLTPLKCRQLSGPHSLFGGDPHPRQGLYDPIGACSTLSLASIGHDRHCHSANHSAARGGVLTLVQLLHGLRLIFVGDSLTGQVSNALECALHREPEVGPIRHVQAIVEMPELARACDLAWHATIAGKIPRLAFEESQCRALGSGTNATRAHETNSSHVTLGGITAPRFNFTFFRRFGDERMYNRAYATWIPPQAQAQAQSNQKGLMVGPVGGLPRHVHLVRTHDLADAIVLNFGLHAGNVSRRAFCGSRESAPAVQATRRHL